MQYSTIFIFSSLLSAIYGELAPLRTVKDAIPSSYIISLKSESRTPIDLHLDQVKEFFTEKSANNKIESVYKNLGKMYHARFTPEVLEKVRGLPDVAFVETDGKVHLNAVQTGAPYGLARLSQRTFSNKSTYTYDGIGAGVTVYVVDTGIQIAHPEFEGRAVWGANYVTGSPNSDENGHGTHCAGTVGSKTYGVSKGVNIVAVKVLDKSGSGSWSSIISGINYVAGDKRGQKGNVLSMSIGGGKIDSVNAAVDAATNKGILSVVAAGNSNDDACKYSPASASTAYTVGATDINDKKASFSSYGTCVKILAPGVNVLSTWNNGGTKSISGTSMATPHVAGLAAYYWAKQSFTVAQLKDHLTSTSTKNAISGFPANTVNYLAYNSIV